MRFAAPIHRQVHQEPGLLVLAHFLHQRHLAADRQRIVIHRPRQRGAPHRLRIHVKTEGAQVAPDERLYHDDGNVGIALAGRPDRILWIAGCMHLALERLAIAPAARHAEQLITWIFFIDLDCAYKIAPVGADQAGRGRQQRAAAVQNLRIGIDTIGDAAAGVRHFGPKPLGGPLFGLICNVLPCHQGERHGSGQYSPVQPAARLLVVSREQLGIGGQQDANHAEQPDEHFESKQGLVAAPGGKWPQAMRRRQNGRAGDDQHHQRGSRAAVAHRGPADASEQDKQPDAPFAIGLLIQQHEKHREQGQQFGAGAQPLGAAHRWHRAPRQRQRNDDEHAGKIADAPSGRNHRNRRRRHHAGPQQAGGADQRPARRSEGGRADERIGMFRFAEQERRGCDAPQQPGRDQCLNGIAGGNRQRGRQRRAGAELAIVEKNGKVGGKRAQQDARPDAAPDQQQGS